jgi:hypothetical protein
MPDNAQHIGSSSESVEDLVEKLNATAEAKKKLRKLCVKATKIRKRPMLKGGLEALRRRGEKSGKKIETEEVERVEKVIDAGSLLRNSEDVDKPPDKVSVEKPPDQDSVEKPPDQDSIKDTWPYWN